MASNILKDKQMKRKISEIFERLNMLKKIKNVLAFGLILAGYNSCNDLDLLPLDRVTTSTFYRTSADFDGAIYAGYSSIQDFWGTSTETLSERGEFWKISMTITDDVVADANLSDGISRDVDNLLIRPTDVPIAAIYTQIYEGILRANLVIENLQGDTELSADETTQFEAEARFLRAFFHFQALKMFGTPPAALEVRVGIDNQALPNATQEALYTAILADFAFATENLPESQTGGNLGRATSWAARSFEGKVNVWREDWGAAITAFEDVVNNGPYALINTGNPTEDYENVFAFDNENNSESIFEVQYGGPFSDDNLWVFDDTHSENFKASQGTGRGWYWDASGGDAPGGKLGWWAPSQDLVDSYETGDARMGVSVYQDGDMYVSTDYAERPYDPTWSTTGFTIRKYRGQRNVVPANHAPNNQADFNNERWFRFAELKLLYAEALIEMGRAPEATTQINDIRNRAGLPDLAAAATLADLQQEKRVEMAFEPHRWFDIVRWDLGPTIFAGDWDARLEVFPFPQSEIDRSEGQLSQNDGY